MQIERDEIARKLEEKKATQHCHRCSHNSFTVLEGFSNIQIQEDLTAVLVIGGPSVPVALIACNNCGAITPHALGALDMLPLEEDDNGK